LANVKKIFSSETAWPNGAKHGKKHLCKILYKTSGNQIYFQIAGHVDLDMLHMFAV
jgi:hypothetical protein